MKRIAIFSAFALVAGAAHADPISVATPKADASAQEASAYVAKAARLFELRIRLAEIAQEAVSLELQASGGRAYLSKPGHGFQRRWREAAFVPIITPSLVQLRGALAAQNAERAA